MNMTTWSYKYDEVDNVLHIVNDNTGAIYETFQTNPNTLNRWTDPDDAAAYGKYRIMQIVASSPQTSIVIFKIQLLDPTNNNLVTDIIKRNSTYYLHFEATTDGARIDFDHTGVLLECKTTNDNKLYLIPFLDGVGRISITFTESGIYTFELDSLRDSVTKKLMTEIYPNIQKNEDLVIAVTDN